MKNQSIFVHSLQFLYIVKCWVFAMCCICGSTAQHNAHIERRHTIKIVVFIEFVSLIFDPFGAETFQSIKSFLIEVPSLLCCYTFNTIHSKHYSYLTWIQPKKNFCIDLPCFVSILNWTFELDAILGAVYCLGKTLLPEIRVLNAF